VGQTRDGYAPAHNVNTHEEAGMAELTNLESKLAEVLGLAMAAKETTGKIVKLVDDEELRATLERMQEEAQQTAERCEEVAGELDGKKTAILEKARETKGEATEMADTYLGDDADALDGLEFMTMTEAGEVGHWKIVQTMAQRASTPAIAELAEWAARLTRSAPAADESAWVRSGARSSRCLSARVPSPGRARWRALPCARAPASRTPLRAVAGPTSSQAVAATIAYPVGRAPID
jgi:hypothetical protein